jgi:hypothetical protein
VINPQELADAVACPARNAGSPCQDAAYCYPKACPRRLKALNQEEHAADAQLEFVFP